MLFNKDGAGQQELKSLLGFIYASTSFQNLVTDLELAQDDLVDVIGKALFDEIEKHYLSSKYHKPGNEDKHELTMDRLVYLAQLPMAFYGYRSYSANADLTHSDKGRQIKVSEEEKPAFEWQIERDNQALQDKYHRFMDRLLVFLESNKDDETIAEHWFNSESFKASRNNLVSSAALFDAVFPINKSRRFYLKVCPFIREVETTRIIPVIGVDLYLQLLGVVRNGSQDQYLQKILDYARIPLVLYTMSTAAKRLSVEILPDGIFQNYVSERQAMKVKQPAPMEFKHEISVLLEKEADSALSRLQQQIAKKTASDAGTDINVQLPTDRRTPEDKHFRV